MLLLRPELLESSISPRTDDVTTRLLHADCAGNDELSGISFQKMEHGIFINCG
jgi:hypothetical protein